MKITYIDPVHCRADKEVIPLLLPCLSYMDEYWRQGIYRRERKEYRARLIDKSGFFLTGFIKRAAQYLNDKKISVKWGGFDSAEKVTFQTPFLPNLTLREDQLVLISKGVKEQRGVLKAPTGIGKTILALGVISSFPGKKVLFLHHEASLMRQTFQEMERQEFKDLRWFGGGKKEILGGISLATIQSMARVDPSIYCNLFDIVIIDECHIGMDHKSLYYRVLTSMLAPIRIGLTATLPETQRSKLYLEGLVGPVIGEMSIKEGIGLNLLAKPKVKIIKTPLSHEVKELRRYPDVYEKGIVNNHIRNRLILKTTKEYIASGKTVLILVTRIEHGTNLSSMAKELYGFDLPFVWSETTVDERTQTRLDLQNKSLKCVVANAVWKHGINIPSLGVVINAAGEKSETATIQRLGRGFRRTSDKDTIIIVDFFDQSHHYLVNHFGNRLCLYMDEGWFE